MWHGLEGMGWGWVGPGIQQFDELKRELAD